MKKNTMLILIVILMASIALNAEAAAYGSSETDGGSIPNELSDELSRQIDELDLEGWNEYFDDIGSIMHFDIDSIDELLLRYANDGSLESPTAIWDVVFGLFKKELNKSTGAICMLTAAAMLTALSGIISIDGIRHSLAFILCGTAVTLTAGVFASLCGIAKNAVEVTGELTERTMPIMSAMLVSLGANASAGIFRPLLTFLSGTVVGVIDRAVMPLVLAGGVLCIVDSLTDGSKLSEIVNLAKKTAKWMLGLLSTFYFGMTVLQGLNVAARDGISIRTAKFAIDKLVPVVGGMVSGSVDNVMGCALLIKNGVGTVAIIILLTIIIRPAIVLAAGVFIFRISAALCQPVADTRVVKLFSGASEITSYLFACVAVSGCMFALTMLVFIAAGGISAGLW
ncbi:MAG: stage III sporulation protein AE [Clostridia bacterium]|nr:stage III sporulation protein AE [Clostridia bacterium]